MTLLEKSFVVVAGKGGVGRTTISLVLGHVAANAGKRTLVCLANAPPRYFDILGDVALDTKVRTISPFLDVVNLEPQSSQEEYGLKVLKNRTVHRLIFGSRVVRGFLDAVPGLAEWAMLGKATYFALEAPDASSGYDLVVFDSPATGHGLDILALPRAISTAVPGGRMHDEALVRCELMEDPARCEVVPVTVPEEMPVNETVEFVAGLNKLGIAVERIVVNMIAPPLVGNRLVDLLASETDETQLPAWLLPSAAALGRQRSRDEALKRLESLLPLEQIRLPLLSGGSLDEASLLSLVDAFSSDMAGRS
ncbi:MAG: ArsA family ATPase [Proteobacteria bacterium]|nr:ArsA family ATPase [Pseudomonadota bacterium]